MCKVKSNSQVVEEALAEIWNELVKVRQLDTEKAKSVILEEVNYLIQSK